MTELVQMMITELRTRSRPLRDEPDAGYSTETVLVTALLVLLAITVVAVLAAKIMAKVQEIQL